MAERALRIVEMQQRMLDILHREFVMLSIHYDKAMDLLHEFAKDYRSMQDEQEQTVVQEVVADPAPVRPAPPVRTGPRTFGYTDADGRVWLTKREVMERLGCSGSTIDVWKHEQKVVWMKPNLHSILFAADSLPSNFKPWAKSARGPKDSGGVPSSTVPAQLDVLITSERDDVDPHG